MVAYVVGKSNLQENDIKRKWLVIYTSSFKYRPGYRLVWFQYRILFKILGTRDYMKKFNCQLTV